MRASFSQMNHLLIQANALTLPLASESVHTVVTSPPYLGLRDYGYQGQIGLEASIEEYLEVMVAVFREVRRVLRKDGVCWCNLGDCYATSPNGRPASEIKAATGDDRTFRDKPGSSLYKGLKPKDLCGIPWRVALALQADGWYLRSDVVWSKPNPLPESVRDRPTKAHEYLFMLTKRDRYYFDQMAVREGAKYGRRQWLETDRFNSGVNGTRQKGRTSGANPSTGRNLRSVWTIPTQALSAKKYGIEDTDHFAAFPERLVMPCVLAGPGEVCANCGAPWERVVERLQGRPERETRKHDQTRLNRRAGSAYMTWREEQLAEREYNGKDRQQDPQFSARRMLLNLKAAREATGSHENPFVAPETVGWVPGCSCGQKNCTREKVMFPYPTVPATVLDPFVGSGTSGVVALRHGRNFVGVDLNPAYLRLAEARIQHSLTEKPKKPRTPRPAKEWQQPALFED